MGVLIQAETTVIFSDRSFYYVKNFSSDVVNMQAINKQPTTAGHPYIRSFAEEFEVLADKLASLLYAVN